MNNPTLPEDRFNQDFFHFLQGSPTPFHAVAFMAGKLRDKGFQQLSETRAWTLTPGGSYFVLRDSGAMAAFTLTTGDYQKQGFRVLGAHTDSPALQLKPLLPKASHSFFQLGVEVYGGPLLAPWFDRDLSIAGRITCLTAEDTLISLLLDFKRPVAVIPSLAIHLDREANNGRVINKQKELAPIFSQSTGEEPLNFSAILTEQMRKEHPDTPIAGIMGFDLFCYDCQPPSFLGLKNEFITAGRLDNLLSCFAGYTAMTTTTADNNRLLICNNHEEVGSLTAGGARGSFLDSVLTRIMPQAEARYRVLRQSFCISMDNAHGVHPNFSDRSEPDHAPRLNHGPVIKANANQNYATTAMSAALYRTIAAEAGVATQDFVMRSDMGCGSTIGPRIAAQQGIPTVDIGAPTLAMHSIREMTGSRDPFLLFRTISRFLDRERLPRLG